MKWFRHIDDFTDDEMIKLILEQSKKSESKYNPEGKPTVLSIQDNFDFLAMYIKDRPGEIPPRIMREWIKGACTLFKEEGDE